MDDNFGVKFRKALGISGKKENFTYFYNDIGKIVWEKGFHSEEAKSIKEAIENVISRMPRPLLEDIRANALIGKVSVKISIEPGLKKSSVNKTATMAELKIGKDILYEKGKIEPITLSEMVSELFAALILDDYVYIKEMGRINENAYFKLEIVKAFLNHKNILPVFYKSFMVATGNWEKKEYLSEQTPQIKERLLKECKELSEHEISDISFISYRYLFEQLMRNRYFQPSLLVASYTYAVFKDGIMAEEDVTALINDISGVKVKNRPSISGIRNLFKEFIFSGIYLSRTVDYTQRQRRFPCFDDTDNMERLRKTLYLTEDKQKFYKAFDELLRVGLNLEEKEIEDINVRFMDKKVFSMPSGDRTEFVVRYVNDVLENVIGRDAYVSFEKYLLGGKGNIHHSGFDRIKALFPSPKIEPLKCLEDIKRMGEASVWDLKIERLKSNNEKDGSARPLIFSELKLLMEDRLIDKAEGKNGHYKISDSAKDMSRNDMDLFYNVYYVNGLRKYLLRVGMENPKRLAIAALCKEISDHLKSGRVTEIDSPLFLDPEHLDGLEEEFGIILQVAPNDRTDRSYHPVEYFDVNVYYPLDQSDLDELDELGPNEGIILSSQGKISMHDKSLYGELQVKGESLKELIATLSDPYFSRLNNAEAYIKRDGRTGKIKGVCLLDDTYWNTAEKKIGLIFNSAVKDLVLLICDRIRREKAPSGISSSGSWNIESYIRNAGLKEDAFNVTSMRKMIEERMGSELKALRLRARSDSYQFFSRDFMENNQDTYKDAVIKILTFASLSYPELMEQAIRKVPLSDFMNWLLREDSDKIINFDVLKKSAEEQGPSGMSNRLKINRLINLGKVYDSVCFGSLLESEEFGNAARYAMHFRAKRIAFNTIELLNGTVYNLIKNHEKGAINTTEIYDMHKKLLGKMKKNNRIRFRIFDMENEVLSQLSEKEKSDFYSERHGLVDVLDKWIAKRLSLASEGIIFKRMSERESYEWLTRYHWPSVKARIREGLNNSDRNMYVKAFAGALPLPRLSMDEKSWYAELYRHEIGPELDDFHEDGKRTFSEIFKDINIRKARLLYKEPYKWGNKRPYMDIVLAYNKRNPLLMKVKYSTRHNLSGVLSGFMLDYKGLECFMPADKMSSDLPAGQEVKVYILSRPQTEINTIVSRYDQVEKKRVRRQRRRVWKDTGSTL